LFGNLLPLQDSEHLAKWARINGCDEALRVPIGCIDQLFAAQVCRGRLCSGQGVAW